jgi:hypothetical protein
MYHPHLHVNNNKRVSDDFLFGSELNEFPDDDVNFYEVFTTSAIDTFSLLMIMYPILCWLQSGWDFAK